ncbi:hypothetical protein LZ198_31370 [Myxococcus sp. K15C18031901]|uniref:hypothetical protein n=1 Tax=Myxococcus dinghuensis TaxID=2906761 RepID=UPI0020A6FB74|nr:hypothetical protein [Myxococcus dinghuensis]MCP3103393.1 hypothetical protein [Myxococcus dinghuensis]
MQAFLGDLKLRALLLATERLMLRARARSERVRQLVDEASHVLQIRTESGCGGYFEVRQGRVRMRFGLHEAPDFTQTWKDGGDAVRALTSRDEADLARAFEAGACRMSGSFLVALWFNEVMKLARPR